MTAVQTMYELWDAAKENATLKAEKVALRNALARLADAFELDAYDAADKQALMHARAILKGTETHE